MRSDTDRRFASVSRRFRTCRFCPAASGFAGLDTFVCSDDAVDLAETDRFGATVVAAAGACAISIPNISERSSLASTFAPVGPSSIDPTRLSQSNPADRPGAA